MDLARLAHRPSRRRSGAGARRVSVVGAAVVLTLAGMPGARAAAAPEAASSRVSVDSLDPAAGATAGGTVVTLKGRGLTGVDKVTFGGVAARHLVHVSPRALKVTTPAHALGKVTVRLYDGGSLRFSWLRAYTYVGAPSITSLTPDAGPLNGRTLTVRGKNLIPGSRVLFDGVPAKEVFWRSDTRLTVRAPAHAAGSVTVRVKTTAGSTAGGDHSTFTYGAKPQVSSFSPELGPEVGGTLVTIDGSNLADVTRVTFGGKEGTALTHVSPTRVTVRSPAHAEDYVRLTVSNRFGSDSPGYFEFQPPGIGGLTWLPGPDAGNTGHGGLTGVDCPTTSFCVGYDRSGAVVTYSGGTWSAPGFVHARFADLSCASASFCGAVDYDYPESPFFVWDGASWRAGPSLPAYVGAIDCWASGACLAVGSGGAYTLSGDDWHATDLDDENFLATDVSCGSPTFCIAVDEVDGTAERYDGTAWTTVLDEPGARLRHVSCLPTGTCAALDGWGGYADSWGLWTYDGSAWTSHPGPLPETGASDVSCSPGGACTVVGTRAGDMPSGWAGNGGGFAIVYDDGWHAPADDLGGSLDGISCPSDTVCTAVGAYLEPAHLDGSTRVERQNGFAVRGAASSWTAPESIDPDRYGDLGELSCPSATFCMSATGVRFDGNAWDASVPINPYGQGMYVYPGGWTASDAHVSCTSESFCLAAGNELADYWNPDFYRGWWSTWNGSSWSAPAPLGEQVSGVSCVSSTHCVMTAMSTSGASGTPQARVFDGVSWGAPTSLPGDVVGSVDCVSATTCFATRTSDLVRLSGGTWSPQAIGADVEYVHDLDCVTASFCLVSVADLEAATASVRRWNGTSWSTGFSAGKINGFDPSLAVDCAAADVCFASQQSMNGYGSNQVWAFDGTSWTGPRQPGYTDSKWPSLVRCVTRDYCLATSPWGDVAIGIRY